MGTTSVIVFFYPESIQEGALSFMFCKLDGVVETPEVTFYVKNIMLAVVLFSSYAGEAKFILI